MRLIGPIGLMGMICARCGLLLNHLFALVVLLPWHQPVECLRVGFFYEEDSIQVVYLVLDNPRLELSCPSLEGAAQHIHSLYYDLFGALYVALQKRDGEATLRTDL